MAFLIFVGIIVILVVINLIVTRINRNMVDDYGTMIENSEKSDAKDRKKNMYIFFKKNL